MFLASDDEFGVVAIGETGVERVRSGLSVRAGEGAFDGQRANFGEGFWSHLRLDVLVDDFFGILGAGGNG